MRSIFDKEYKRLISQLKKSRLEQNISQKTLASKMGVTQSYISKIEQGQIRLDIIQLKNIAKHLGRNVKDFME